MSPSPQPSASSSLAKSTPYVPPSYFLPLPNTNPPIQDISSLLQHTSDALRAIAKPPTTNSSASTPSNALAGTAPETYQESQEAALSNFKAIQSEFLNTLDRIDKQLKRQIYALEEAGIITLRNTGEQAEGGEGAGTAGPGTSGGAAGGEGTTGKTRAKEVVARLDPDGVGRYGSLDVGQLNMASSTVERDLEQELWAKARELTARMAAQKASRGDQMQE